MMMDNPFTILANDQLRVQCSGIDAYWRCPDNNFLEFGVWEPGTIILMLTYRKLEQQVSQ